MTGSHEGYDDTLAYAAAASCAIVSTKVGIANVLVEDGVSGYLCGEDDAAHFTECIIAMIRKPALCDTVRLNANLSIQKFMSSDEEAYLKFLQGSWETAITMAKASNLLL